jgi:uncharacterized protein (TIGR04562 family)
MTMNIRPSRSRNNLIDPKLYRRTWREIQHAIKRGEVADRAAVDDALDRALAAGYHEAAKEIAEHNPHSSKEFYSIQFTCRQLVKYRSPIYDEVKALRGFVKSVEDPELRKALERVDYAHLAKEQRFFYPFEVQIMDRANYEESENGRASHAAYKANQAQMAMRRVLGQLITASPRETEE